jgi:hypothetical protein
MIDTHVCDKPGLNIGSPLDKPRTFIHAVLDEKLFAFKDECSSISR